MLDSLLDAGVVGVDVADVVLTVKKQIVIREGMSSVQGMEHR